MRPWRQVQELLGEGLGQVLDDVVLADDTHQVTLVVDERDVPITAGLHELDRVTDRLVEVERSRLGGHQRFDRLTEVDLPADDALEDVPLGQDAPEPAVGTKTESPVPVRWIARKQSARLVPGGTVTGWRRLRTRRRSSVRDGTRLATTPSERSVTLEV